MKVLINQLKLKRGHVLKLKNLFVTAFAVFSFGPAFVAQADSMPTQMQSAADIIDLQKIDTVVGAGAEAKPNMTVSVHYTGWLYSVGTKDHKGQKFDSSLDRGQPFSFPLGAGRVIRGWDEGVSGMKVGGKRTLIIPPQMGYGSRGAGNVIPPNATLLFDVELLGVK
jgi:FKBP-type peptidyl-prolyl cis-trans isomerase FkpA